MAHFMERLAVLPLLTWYDLAEGSPDKLADASEWALREALREPGLAWDVWSTRDDVETVMYRFDRPDGREYIARQGSRGHIRLITERAALAILVRSALRAMHFVICYGAFERVIPSSTL